MTLLGTRESNQYFCHMLSSIVIRMLILSICVCLSRYNVFFLFIYGIFVLCFNKCDVIYGLSYEWARSRFVNSFAHTHMHFHDINSMLEFRPFRRKCWLRSREIVISVMASLTLPEFMVLMTS